MAMQPRRHACVYGQGSTLGTEHPMKKIITLTLVAAALAVSACNTISGVGRDVSAAGDAVAAGAEEAKN
ncbi:MAG: entericidin A/B family lipoprotein [Brevundimonas sp.]|nr:MAG: entericidin A/B family lipoprotein [Brevundimonas sp.]